MVGIVREVVIPVKKVVGGDSVLTIVCEVVDNTRRQHHQQHQHHHQHYHHQQEQMEEAPNINEHLWKMASAWRVISFFLVVFVLPTVLISLPLYARYHLYHARNLPMTETDTRALDHAVSSFWCQGQRVSSNGSLDAYLVSGAPRVKEERRHVNLRRSLTLQHDDIEYWGVYLLEGSIFSVSSTARWAGGTMLVVQGEENLRKCFYREDRVKDALADPAGVVGHRGPMDTESESGKTKHNRIMDEERHWQGENNGGEVFDDGDLDGHLDIFREEEIISEEEETLDNLNDPEGLLAAEDEDPLVRTHKYDLHESLDGKRRGKKGLLTKKRPEKSNIVHDRSRRSPKEDGGHLLDGRLSTPSDPNFQVNNPGVQRGRPLTIDENLDILQEINDTMFVHAGESSYSSSEEFMEQCRNALLMVDLTPYIQWENHVSTNDSTSTNVWTFSVNASNYFYFIFTSDNNLEKNEIGFELDLQRAIYDVSAPLRTCRNATECVFPLAFTGTEAVVVEVPAGEHLQELHSFEVTTACQPRVPVYMVFILLVPFIILLFAFQ